MGRDTRYPGETKNGSLQSCVVKHRSKVAGATVKRGVLFIRQGTIIEVDLFFFGMFRGSVPSSQELETLYGTPEPPGRFEPHVYGAFVSYSYDYGQDSTTLDNYGESHFHVTTWTRSKYMISWLESLSMAWREMADDNPIQDLLDGLLHTTKGQSMGHFTFAFRPTAVSPTDQDRQNFVALFNKSIASSNLGAYASSDRTRFIIHSPKASQQLGDLLFSNEQFVGALRIAGFAKFLHTNDADKTFEWDVTPASSAALSRAPAVTPREFTPKAESNSFGVAGLPTDSGFKITVVREGSPAADIYLKPGDVISKIDYRAVKSGQDIDSAVAVSVSGAVKVTGLALTVIGMAPFEREFKVH